MALHERLAEILNDRSWLVSTRAHEFLTSDSLLLRYSYETTGILRRLKCTREACLDAAKVLGEETGDAVNGACTFRIALQRTHSCYSLALPVFVFNGVEYIGLESRRSQDSGRGYCW